MDKRRKSYQMVTQPVQNGRKREVLLGILSGSIVIFALIAAGIVFWKTSGNQAELAQGLQDFPSKPLAWWQSGSIYSVFLSSFSDSDGGSGDIRGLGSKLDYIQSLGFDIIWLSSILRRQSVYPENNPNDFTMTHFMNGDMDDFEDLISTLKIRNMKLIMDFEINHSSKYHDWFIDSAEGEPEFQDFYIWRPCFNNSLPNNWMSLRGGPAWRYRKERNACYLHQIQANVADLNYNNPYVLGNMSEAIKFWLSKGVDGIHLRDSEYILEDPNFPDEDIAADGHDRKRSFRKNRPESYSIVKHFKNIVESYKDPERALLITSGRSLQHKQLALESSHLVFQTDLIETLNSKSNCEDFRGIFQEILNSTRDRHCPTWVSGSWDFSRLKTRLETLSKAFQVIQFLLRGTPVVYYGEEIGMKDVEIPYELTKDPFAQFSGEENYAKISKDPFRTPMQWNSGKNAGFSIADKPFLPVHPNYATVNVENQEKEKSSLLNLIRHLNELRQRYLSITEIDIKCNRDILIIKRFSSQNHGLHILVNFAEKQSINLKDLLENTEFQVDLVTSNSGWERVESFRNAMDLDRHGTLVLIS